MIRYSKQMLLGSSGLLLVATSLIVAGTYALFSASKDYTTHIQTGNLDFQLLRTKLDGLGALEDGTIGTLPTDTTIVDLTESGKEAFKLINVVPRCSYVATFELENIGTTAFKSTVKVVTPNVTDLEGNDADDYILDYLNITISCGQASSTFALADWEDTAAFDLGNTLVGAEPTEFKITAALDEEAGNDAQNVCVDFGIQLHSVQILEA